MTQSASYRKITNSPEQLQGELAKRFHFKYKIGEGTYGTVIVVVDKQTGYKYALKKVKLSKKAHGNGIPISSLREICILKKLDHPNIIKIKDVFYNYEKPQLSFILEYHQYNLNEYMKHFSRLTMAQIRKFTYQLLSGIQYLHRRCIMHRDLKPQNILINSSGMLRICDFGQSKLIACQDKQHTTDISTLWYRAPQIILGGEDYDYSIDIWAAGCIIAEMVLNKPLFKANSQVGILFSMFKLFGTPKLEDFPQLQNLPAFSSNYPKFQQQQFKIQGISASGEDLLRKMLIINSKKRISIETALHHNFLLYQQL